MRQCEVCEGYGALTVAQLRARNLDREELTARRHDDELVDCPACYGLGRVMTLDDVNAATVSLADVRFSTSSEGRKRPELPFSPGLSENAPDGGRP